MPNADALAPMFDALESTRASVAQGAWLYFNAEPDHRLASADWKDHLLCRTPNKAKHDQLKASGLSLEPLANGPAALALVRLTRDRAETFGLIAEAISTVQPGAPVLVFGENDEGIRTVERQVSVHWDIVASISKRHARCFVFHAQPQETVAIWAAAAAPPAESEIRSQPGLFAHDRLDLGSAVLIEQLPDDLVGVAADFGCGWGALSVALLNRNAKLQALDMIDIDQRAVAAALANAGALAHPARLQGLWADIAAGDVPARHYDVIVMNPPFHASNRPDPGLGAAFVAAASKALKPGGLLFLVANRKLPYEPQLKTGFRSSKMLFEGEGFKVYRAMR